MKKLGFIFLLSFSHFSFAEDCHPKIESSLPQYIIGYGSLMDEHSKKMTDPTAQENFPITIKGYKRSWSVHGNLPGLNATFLSVTEDHSASSNGVIYQLTQHNSMDDYDKRERTYCRKHLSGDQIQTYNLKLPTQKQVWIYYSTQKRNQPPSADFPKMPLLNFVHEYTPFENQSEFEKLAKH